MIPPKVDHSTLEDKWPRFEICFYLWTYWIPGQTKALPPGTRRGFRWQHPKMKILILKNWQMRHFLFDIFNISGGFRCHNLLFLWKHKPVLSKSFWIKRVLEVQHHKVSYILNPKPFLSSSDFRHTKKQVIIIIMHLSNKDIWDQYIPQIARAGLDNQG